MPAPRDPRRTWLVVVLITGAVLFAVAVFAVMTLGEVIDLFVWGRRG